MSSDLNGEHTATSKKYLVDLLRREMEFKGALVTDFGQINRLYINNSVTSSLKEALYISISLGTIDFNMDGVGIASIPLIKELVKEGAILESTIDTSVRRILKNWLGLLDSTGHVDIAKLRSAKIGSQEDIAKAINAARESIILLQNNMLPLSPSAKLLITGPASDSLRLVAGPIRGWVLQM
ncbi:hypothetical protein DSO57_1004813 [Entomophthora muscae]|uniref:Uncharacterized protein n=1 Tax=Entomophthora muscae TaxID=34485 RepID=A0ACC2RMW0_9FUNG|nr:hypothetical protein DSO57_1004813 [Entomophthora muscae]